MAGALSLLVARLEEVNGEKGDSCFSCWALYKKSAGIALQSQEVFTRNKLRPIYEVKLEIQTNLSAKKTMCISQTSIDYNQCWIDNYQCSSFGSTQLCTTVSTVQTTYIVWWFKDIVKPPKNLNRTIFNLRKPHQNTSRVY